MSQLFLKAFCCNDLAELCNDEICFVITAKHSNGQLLLSKYPRKASHFYYNKETSTHCLEEQALLNFSLQENESIAIVIAVFEEDSINVLKYTQLSTGILNSIGNPYAIPAGTILRLKEEIWPANTIDYVGAFSCQIKKTKGFVHTDWRVIDRISNAVPNIHGNNTYEFRMNGDGSDYNSQFWVLS